MTPLPARRLLLAALGLAVSAAPTLAGWNHVANATCNNGGLFRRAFKPADDCNDCSTPAPAPARSPTTVEYETTTHYETITVMRPERYQEPVDVKVKSYYWEPVQSYSYRSYYDPCSGECQQVAVPRTSYVRKEDCRTETRYLEKVRMVPVQEQREYTETRPKYTYYGPVTRRYGPTTSTPPSEYRSPRVEEGRGGSVYTPIPDPKLPTTPGTGMPKKMPEREIPKIDSRTPPSASNYPFNALSTSAAKESGAKVYGEVTGADKQSPVPNAKLVFVSATDLSDKRYVTADAFGGFDAKLPAGDWHVYAGPGTGTAVRTGKVTVADGVSQPLTVVVK